MNNSDFKNMNIKFTDTHEWVLKNDDDTITIGITEYAQEALGDVVFVELPEEGREVNAGDDLALVESVKAASDIYAPVSGEVIETNVMLEEKPELINTSPVKEGWIARLRVENMNEFNELLSFDDYQATLN